MAALPLSSQRCPMWSMLAESMQAKWCTCCESYCHHRVAIKASPGSATRAIITWYNNKDTPQSCCSSAVGKRKQQLPRNLYIVIQTAVACSCRHIEMRGAPQNSTCGFALLLTTDLTIPP